MCIGYEPLDASLPYLLMGVLLFVFTTSFYFISLTRDWKLANVKVINISLLSISVAFLLFALLKINCIF